MRISRLMLVILSGLVLQPVFAAPHDRQDAPQEKRRAGDGKMTSNDAARIAQKQEGGGRVLSVTRTEDGYRVKLLKKGDVHIVFVPLQ